MKSCLDEFDVTDQHDWGKGSKDMSDNFKVSTLLFIDTPNLKHFNHAVLHQMFGHENELYRREWQRNRRGNPRENQCNGPECGA